MIKRLAAILLLALGVRGAFVRATEMGDCPSSVPGAVTTVDNRRDGLVLSITADDPGAQDEIRARAHRQVDGASGGACPAMRADTVVTVRDLPEGALVRVQARNPGDVAELQQSAHARLDELRRQR